MNVCTTELDGVRRYRHSISEGRRHHSNATTTTTTSSYDNYSFYTTTSRNSSFEVIFSRLLDVLIFTSAIAITAYSYLTGTLGQPFVEPKPVLVGYQKRPVPIIIEKKPHHHHPHYDPIEEAKKKRTQEWAEGQITQKRRSCPSLVEKKVQPLLSDGEMKREKKRTLSLPESKPDELLSLVQSLIQQGQDALSTPVAYNGST